MLKRLLLLSFSLGCAVSVLASGRFTPRLIADGMASFAFVPLAELAGFALARRALAGRGRFSADADRFLHGNWPWLVWTLTVALVAALTPPAHAFEAFNLMAICAIVPIAASIRLDYRLFRSANTRGRAAAAVLVQRSVAWPLVLIYFLGVAMPARSVLHAFVEVGEMMSASIKVLLS